MDYRSKVLQDELNPITFPKYCLKMATGSGKTWVLNALMVWHFFNTLNGERPGLFTNRFLIVTPGKEVQKRILEAVRLGGETDINKPLFMPSGMRWRDRFYFELYEPNDFRENLTLTDDAFVVVTNWQQFRFAKDDPSLWEELERLLSSKNSQENSIIKEEKSPFSPEDIRVKLFLKYRLGMESVNMKQRKFSLK